MCFQSFQIVMTFFIVLFTFSCGSDSESQGGEGDPCYPNGTCDEGLSCRSDFCVDLNAGSDDGNDGSDPVIDFDDCFACGSESCEAEAEACEAADGCDDALRCWLNCTTDTDCIADCDVSALNTSEELQKLQSYASCIALNCVERCAPDVNVSTDPNDTDTQGGESCTGDVSEGSCATGDARTCVDGQWVDDNCDACSIVSPTSMCGEMVAFVLDSSYEPVEGDLVSFEQTTTSATATFNFSSSTNTGYIQLNFGGSEMLSGAAVDAASSSGTVDATLENSDSSAGCEYSISASTGYLSQTASDYCWGGGYDPMGGDYSAIINIRLPASSTGQKTLTVYGIDLL